MILAISRLKRPGLKIRVGHRHVRHLHLTPHGLRVAWMCVAGGDYLTACPDCRRKGGG